MPVEFRGEVISVMVKSKKTRVQVRGEDGDFHSEEIVQKIGRIQLEFDGDSVDVTKLAAFIAEAPVRLEMASTQERFGG